MTFFLLKCKLMSYKFKCTNLEHDLLLLLLPFLFGNGIARYFGFEILI